MELNASNPTAQYLVNHAALNVNCRPQLDNQFRIKMLRISHYLGATKTIRVFNRTINLPDEENTYHVFLIGRQLGEDFNVGASKMFWRNLSDFCNARGTYYNIYTDDGLEFPLTTVWTGNLENDIMLVCVLAQPRIADLGKVDAYWRTYANADFSEDVRNAKTRPPGREVQVIGGVVVLSSYVLQWQRQFHAWQQEIKENGYGWVWCSINGQRVNDIPPNSFEIGDSIQVVYDKSVIRQYSFKVEDLKTYTSKLDSKNKYLLHPPKNNKLDNRIQYRDDVDIYVRNKNGVGRYFHYNQENAIRMITHRDYGIPVDYVAYFVERLADVHGLRDITLEVVIRESGLPIALSFEHNRIHELYKLSDKAILAAMVELNANIPEFHAAELEQSNYTRIMREYESQITIDQVTDAYGYNAMAKLVADSPQIIDVLTGVRAAPVPWGLRANATYYEYDKNGLLLGVTQHPGGQWFYPQFADTHYAEGRSGVGGRTLDYVIGTADVPLREWSSFRCYKAKLASGKPVASTWIDVTDDEGQVSVVDGKIRWGIDSRIETGMVLFDTRFLAYQTKINHRNHTVWLDLTAGMDIAYPLPFEPELLELWIGDESGKKSYSLVKDFDYTVQWPTVVINAKRFFPATDIKTVTVRCSGFPQSDLIGLKQPDVGWTKHGLLSYSDVFNVRDDHVVRVVVGGRVYDRSEVVTHEDTQFPANLKVPDGTPYAVFRVAPPIRGLIIGETQYLRERSLVTDQRVSDYMSLYFPKPDLSAEPVAIENPYQLISPFLMAVTYDVVNKILVPKPDLVKMELDKYLEAYLWFLDFDPALRDMDERYVSIHPHDLWTPIDIGLEGYRFIERLSREYLQDKVLINRFYTVKGA